MATDYDFTKNPIWVKRVEGFFDAVDTNSKGLMSINDILSWADNLEKACKVTPKETKALREVMQMFWGVIGLVPGAELNREQFIEGFNRLANEELKRRAENKSTLLSRQNNAFFDVIDVKNDGTVTVKEARTVMDVCTFGVDAGEAWFDAADTNKDGRIDREQLSNIGFDYWFRPDRSIQDIFGGLFE